MNLQKSSILHIQWKDCLQTVGDNKARILSLFEQSAEYYSRQEENDKNDKFLQCIHL